jgi:hypothetical protein
MVLPAISQRSLEASLIFLFAKLLERSKAIDQLLEIKRNDSAESDEHPTTEQIEKKAPGPRLTRYRNE